MFVLSQTLINTAICVAFLCGEAVVVEHSQGSNRAHANKLQVWIWGSNTVGAFVGSTIGGQLEALVNYKIVFFLSIFPPLIGIPFQWNPSLERNVEKHRPFCEYFWELWCCIKNKHYWGCALWLFLYNATPSMGSTTFYYYTNILHVDKETMSLTGTVGSIAGFYGYWIYYRYFSQTSARPFMFWGNIIVTLLGALQLLLFTGYNKVLGIPNIPFIYLDDTVMSVASQVISIPPLAVVAMMCPSGMEATVFCFFTALTNFSSNVVSTQLSVLMIDYFGVTAHNFDNIVALRIWTLAINILPSFLIFLMPSDETVERLSKSSRDDYMPVTPDDPNVDDSDAKQALDIKK